MPIIDAPPTAQAHLHRPHDHITLMPRNGTSTTPSRASNNQANNLPILSISNPVSSSMTPSATTFKILITVLVVCLSATLIIFVVHIFCVRCQIKKSYQNHQCTHRISNDYKRRGFHSHAEIVSGGRVIGRAGGMAVRGGIMGDMEIGTITRNDSHQTAIAQTERAVSLPKPALTRRASTYSSKTFVAKSESEPERFQEPERVRTTDLTQPPALSPSWTVSPAECTSPIPASAIPAACKRNFTDLGPPLSPSPTSPIAQLTNNAGIARRPSIQERRLGPFATPLGVTTYSPAVLNRLGIEDF